MRVLVVGGGGREHALVWRLSRDGHHELLCLPGNAGIARLAECLPGNPEHVASTAQQIARVRPDLAVIGPEDPLALGLADVLREEGMVVYGPSAVAAAIESSKAFSKEFMHRHDIPTAQFSVFSNFSQAGAHLRTHSGPVVVKACGLAKGKGVQVCENAEVALEAVKRTMVEKAFGAAGEVVVLEEQLLGEEASVCAFVDSRNVVLLPPAQDYKRIFDGDQGPNTGGMGCYSPVPALSPDHLEFVRERVLEGAVRGLAEEQRPYIGTLYAGLVLTTDGPKVLEFNCRFGDPESQVMLPLLAGDFGEIMLAAAQGDLSGVSAKWRQERAVCVVVASGGYPGEYRKGMQISGLEEAEAEGAIVFHAGTSARDGQVVTGGGRVLGVTGVASTFAQAREAAYRAVGRIQFEGMAFRRDIALRVVGKG